VFKTYFIGKSKGAPRLPRLRRIDPAQRALGRLLPRALMPGRQADWRLALVETIGVMLVAIALSAWLRPADPLWTGAAFPWLWLLVAMLALRYGSAHGVVGMALALGAWFVLDALGAPLGAFPRASFLGGLVLALVAGAYADRWMAQLSQGQAVNAYLDERLQVLTHHHFLLSVSHDRLEQELLTRPFTLRETLYTLRQLLKTDANPRSLPAADWLLQMLARTCRVEAAALFPIQALNLAARPAATLGSFGGIAGNVTESGKGELRGEFNEHATLDHNDPMLLAALESGQLMHVQSEPFVDAEAPSRYVICAPLAAADGTTYGVLVVERIAFTALTLENLQFMTVLLAYYADSLDPEQRTAPLLTAFSRCPPEFALELARAQRLLTTAFLRSALVAFRLPADAARAEDLAQRLQRLSRSLDVSWLHTESGKRVLLVLLPLTDATGLAGYAERIERQWREQYGADLAASGVTVHSAELDERELTPQIVRLLERAHA
jgi:hypothetical protein